MENNLVPHQNTKKHYDPVILFLSIHPKEEKYPRFIISTLITLMVALFTIIRRWKFCAGTRPGVNRSGLYNMLWEQPSLMPGHKSTQTMRLRLTESQTPSVELFAGWVTQRLWSSDWLRLIWNYLKEHFARRIQKIFFIK